MATCKFCGSPIGSKRAKYTWGSEANEKNLRKHERVCKDATTKERNFFRNNRRWPEENKRTL